VFGSMKWGSIGRGSIGAYRRERRSARLGLDEGAEGLGERGPAPLAVGGEEEGAADLEVLHAEAPHAARPTFLLHRPARHERHPDPRLDRLLARDRKSVV